MSLDAIKYKFANKQTIPGGWLGGWLAGNEVKIMLAQLNLSLAKRLKGLLCKQVRLIFQYFAQFLPFLDNYKSLKYNYKPVRNILRNTRY